MSRRSVLARRRLLVGNAKSPSRCKRPAPASRATASSASGRSPSSRAISSRLHGHQGLSSRKPTTVLSISSSESLVPRRPSGIRCCCMGRSFLSVPRSRGSSRCRREHLIDVEPSSLLSHRRKVQTSSEALKRASRRDQRGSKFARQDPRLGGRGCSSSDFADRARRCSPSFGEIRWPPRAEPGSSVARCGSRARHVLAPPYRGLNDSFRGLRQLCARSLPIVAVRDRHRRLLRARNRPRAHRRYRSGLRPRRSLRAQRISAQTTGMKMPPGQLSGRDRKVAPPGQGPRGSALWAGRRAFGLRVRQ